MVPVRSELLRPAHVLRRGICAANITANGSRLRSQVRKRPLQIGNAESSVLPVCHRVFIAKTIEIDRHVNIRPAEVRDKLFEQGAPVFLEDRAGTLSILRWAIVGPRMNFEPPAALRAAIGEDIVRPPAFKISATPDRNMFDVRKLERAVDPAAARPLRRRDCPIRMIVERKENERLVELA